jgi:hypothetical protein
MTDNAGGPGLPPELMNNDPDGFAWGVWHDRTPKLVAQIRDAYPYGPEQRNALDALLDEIASGPMQPLGSDARDHQLWMTWGSGYFGKPWLDTPFLWSESYFYRRVLDATGFFAPGPWHHVDPFAQMKAAELTDSAMELDLATLDDVQRLPVEQQGRAKLMASLWGNQADLGFRIDRPVAPADAEGLTLVADDRDQLWSRLDGTARVAVVADNAGRELLADLVLADHLLQHGHAASITFHVKPYPYYVSDATTSDVVACLGRLTSAPGSASEIGHRLLTRASEGRLSLYTHDFHCAPWSYHRPCGPVRVRHADHPQRRPQLSATRRRSGMASDGAVRRGGLLLPRAGGGAPHSQVRRRHRTRPSHRHEPPTDRPAMADRRKPRPRAGPRAPIARPTLVGHAHVDDNRLGIGHPLGELVRTDQVHRRHPARPARLVVVRPTAIGRGQQDDPAGCICPAKPREPTSGGSGCAEPAAPRGTARQRFRPTPP